MLKSHLRYFWRCTKRWRGIFAAGIAVPVVFSGCDVLFTNWNDVGFEGVGHYRTPWTVTTVAEYDDIRWGILTGVEEQLDSAMIPTFWMNMQNVWPSKFSVLANSVMERSKNPGLGVRSLHSQGVTGAGVTVAIIDQNICLEHSEYAGKVIEYHTVGTVPQNEGSMHGPAVLSLLVGNTIGTAPGAKVYFVAAPSWTADAKYQADALRWIIDKNRQLPAGKKIRAVSISAAPSGPGTPFTKNNSEWDAARQLAEQEGIIVLDCTQDHGKTAAGYYEPESPDSLAGVTPGYSGFVAEIDTGRLYIPTSKRTTAEEYEPGLSEYQYTGRGGLSWSIPYLTGVLAMGWQIRPELTGEQMLALAFGSAYRKDGARIINPTVFIDSVRAFN